MNRKLVSFLFLLPILTLSFSAMHAQIPQFVKKLGHDRNTYNEAGRVKLNGKMFYVVNDDELWISDGTSAGTFQLKDFNMSAYKQVGIYSTLNNKIQFVTQLNGNGTSLDLWESDGTVSGTKAIKKLGHNYSQYYGLGEVTCNGKAYYVVNDDELWISDGTTVGTFQLKDFNMSANKQVGIYSTLNNKIQFTTQLNGNGTSLDLWESDGTIAGTKPIKKLAHDYSQYYGLGEVTSNGKAYYVVNNDELWVSDGTTAGTFQLKDFNMSANKQIGIHTTINNKIQFTTQLNGNGTSLDLWESDGTIAGTKPIKKLAHDYTQYYGLGEVTYNGKAYYVVNRDELWVSDGTTAGTFQLKDFNMSANKQVSIYTTINNKIQFTTQLNGNGTSLDLWESDGTTAGTKPIKKLAHDCTQYYNVGYMQVGGKMFYIVNSEELWVSDGTTVGTVQLKDFNMSAYKQVSIWGILNNKIQFTTQLNGNGSSLDLWESDGTAAGTKPIKKLAHDYTTFNSLFRVETNGKIFYIVNQDQLWASDGTTVGTSMLKDFHMLNSQSLGYFEILGDKLLFTAQENGDASSMDLWTCQITPFTAVSDLNASTETKIYPIPTKDYLTIESFLNGAETNATYTIYDIAGRTLSAHTGKRIQTTIDVNDLREGVYILVLNDDHGYKYSQKFIKSN